MASDILIVDDEADICELVSGLLQDEGYTTRTARDSDSALAAVASRRPNLVFLDIWLQGSRLDGLQLLDAMKGQHPELPVVMISGHGNIETAVAAMDLDFLLHAEHGTNASAFAARVTSAHTLILAGNPPMDCRPSSSTTLSLPASDSARSYLKSTMN
jgi:DNA-binding NtrC family response regulator